jgi:hypothetical protein
MHIVSFNEQALCGDLGTRLKLNHIPNDQLINPDGLSSPSLPSDNSYLIVLVPQIQAPQLSVFDIFGTK